MTARAILNAGGQLDISGVVAGVGIGSLEGAGTVFLGGKRLSVGGLGAATTFSGLLADGGFFASSGGGLTVGPGRLTQAGGVIAPGDPTTLTLENDLIWDGGGTIRLVLGADQAGSDLLKITGLLERGDMTGGTWTFDLINDGTVIGQTYDLVEFGGLQGFSASDFRFTGVAGDFVINGDGLEFTVNAVPEPGTIYLLVVLGTLSIAFVCIRRSAIHQDTGSHRLGCPFRNKAGEDDRPFAGSAPRWKRSRG